MDTLQGSLMHQPTADCASLEESPDDPGVSSPPFEPAQQVGDPFMQPGEVGVCLRLTAGHEAADPGCTVVVVVPPSRILGPLARPCQGSPNVVLGDRPGDQDHDVRFPDPPDGVAP